jgi:hypothetical protein
MTVDRIVSYPIDVLCSFHYYRTDAEQMIRFHDQGKMRFIADSGAFSAYQLGATITPAKYATWCHTLAGRLHWCASLDVIGDPQQSWRNWVMLRDRYQLPTVPTLHAGTDTRWLDAYVKEGVDLIGLGGMAGLGQAPRAFRWAVHTFRHARRHHPHLRFHLWGVTGFNFLETLPAWSSDSSGFLGSVRRWARIRIFDPTTGKAVMGDMRRVSGTSMYRLGAILRNEYGVDPALVQRSTEDNRALTMRLAIGSAQRYATWLQQRHQVTAPSTYQGAATTGPRIYVVSSKIAELTAAVA